MLQKIFVWLKKSVWLAKLSAIWSFISIIFNYGEIKKEISGRQNDLTCLTSRKPHRDGSGRIQANSFLLLTSFWSDAWCWTRTLDCFLAADQASSPAGKDRNRRSRRRRRRMVCREGWGGPQGFQVCWHVTLCTLCGIKQARTERVQVILFRITDLRHTGWIIWIWESNVAHVSRISWRVLEIKTKSIIALHEKIKYDHILSCDLGNRGNKSSNISSSSDLI